MEEKTTSKRLKKAPDFKEVPVDTRFDIVDHWPVHRDERPRCFLCKEKTRRSCSKCKKGSSVKWSDPGHFVASEGNFFCHFHVPYFYMFLTTKIMDESLKRFLGRSILHYHHFCNI